MQTYDEAEFTPGPRLNLVLAPNGRLVHSLKQAMSDKAPPMLRHADARAHLRRHREVFPDLRTLPGLGGRPFCALPARLLNGQHCRPPDAYHNCSAVKFTHRITDLATNPAQILGRGENIRAFIKHGMSEAMTEVTLSSGNLARPVVIRRTYYRDGTSIWKINGTVLCHIICLSN